MNDISEEYFNYVLEKVAETNGLTSWRYEQQNFQSIAQNYFGVIIPTKLYGIKNGKDICLNLVLKLAPTDERYRVSGAVTKFFEREIFVYSHILPKYRQFLKNKSDLKDFIIPECYYLNTEYCKEVICMQNMCACGYEPYTKDYFLDIQHMRVTMICLAKFHALSFMLETKESSTFTEALEICEPLSRKANERFMNILLDRLQKAKTYSNAEYTNILENFENRIDDYVEAVFKSVNARVLCHGDIWKENLLFKCEDSVPTSVCMIDYQTTRTSSPAYDVLFLIITSTDLDLRRQHYKDLLNIYYHTLEQILLESQIKTYSREMFEQDLKIVAPACFIIANTAIWLSSGLQQEGHVRSKIILGTEEQRATAINNYKNRISAILDDFKNYGYL